LGAWLATLLRIPHVPLDGVYWEPDWRPKAKDEFRAATKAIMEENKRGWIIDGDYSQTLDDIVRQEATDIICEYPHAVRRS